MGNVRVYLDLLMMILSLANGQLSPGSFGSNPNGPTQADPGYNSPTQPNPIYPSPTQPNQGYNSPTQPNPGYPSPTQPNPRYNSPTQPNSGYNTPTQTNPGSVSDGHPHQHGTHRHLRKHKHTGDPLCGLRIVCIYNNYHSYRNGFEPGMILPHLCTHLNYEFAMLDPETYELISADPENDLEGHYYQEAIDLKIHNAHLKVLLSVGGWHDSTKKYSEMAADKEKRVNFCKKAVEYCRKHKFDGLDVAWEFPNCWQGNCGVNPSDKDNFSLLLKECKEECEPYGLILSISVSAIKREIEHAYDIPAISAVVDYINVMTYDMHGPWESKTGHHAQFEKLPDDKDPDCNVKGGLNVWLDKGAPKEKLNMGLAFYGKSYTLANPEKCGMGDDANGIGKPGPVSNEGGVLQYYELCQFLNSGTWTENEVKEAGVYAYSGDQWVCFDPPMMMARKVKWLVQSGLGGVLLKDLGGDDWKGNCSSLTFPLTKIIRMQMIHICRKMHRG